MPSRQKCAIFTTLYLDVRWELRIADIENIVSEGMGSTTVVVEFGFDGQKNSKLYIF